MVQTDISLMTRECSDWRASLRSHREQLNGFKSQLQELANRPLSREQLTEVEHYHNQFHIQLINIHDLKQLVKAHDRRVSFESVAHQGQITEETQQDHESLLEEHNRLELTLHELRQAFTDFTHRTQ